jgi:glycyl-tRNA synthetase beta chain
LDISTVESWKDVNKRGDGMARELLLEIGTEELPAGFIPPALDELAGSTRKAFQEARIGYENVEVFGTPRRLVLRVTDVAEKQEDLVQEQQGPASRVAFDEDGKPTKAARGFAESRGVSLKDLEVRETPKGAYVFARVFTAGRTAAEILPGMLPDLIAGLSFPKTMRWGTGDLRFARPIRWLLALLDDEVIPFSFGTVSSGDRTYGHRQLSPGPFTVPSAHDYWHIMDQAGIVVDARARRKKIWKGLVAAAAKKGGQPLPDEELLDTVTYLVEVPTPLCGTLQERFLSLPREVLTTALSEHQRCFAAVDENDHLLPLFLAVSNGDPRQADLILRGFRRVLTARLEDARFFFEEDRKTPLSDRVEALKSVVFQEDLGTMYEKTERIVALVEHLGAELDLSPAERKTLGPPGCARRIWSPSWWGRKSSPACRVTWVSSTPWPQESRQRSPGPFSSTICPDSPRMFCRNRCPAPWWPWPTRWIPSWAASERA